MIIVGTKFYGHDSAIYRIDTRRRELFAISTERITRKKHDSAPVFAAFDLLSDEPIDVVAHSFSAFDKPAICSALYIDKMAVTGATARLAKEIGLQREAMQGAGVPAACTNRMAMEAMMRHAAGRRATPATQLLFYDHHLCHAVSAYNASHLTGRNCLVLTLDGWGDGFFSKAYIFRGTEHQEIGASATDVFYPAGKEDLTSIGRIYEHFTVAAGFKANSDEGKLEALAAFGTPIQPVLAALKDACIIAHNNIYISPHKIAPFYDQAYLAELVKVHGVENCAATVQVFLEDIVVDYINALTLPPDVDGLCLTGGVAANIIMNMKIYERTKFKDIHVSPYMGDEGTACGAALLAASRYNQDVSWISGHVMPYLGTSYGREEIKTVLSSHAGTLIFTDLADEWPLAAAREIAEGKIIAVFQGKMEFGPRALGNRSILANPADPTIRERINVSIKRRPPWQPFCPSILESERERLFMTSLPHKFMAIAFRIKPEYIPALPSAVHIDGTTRPQFVSPADNPAYHQLLEHLRQLTGFGVVINTSFNLHGRTIVMTPADAIDDFLDCNLDTLYIEGFRVKRRQ